MTQEEYLRQLDDRRRKNLQNSPFIAWYRLHPENGKVEKLNETPEGGTHLRAEEHSWRPMPDGSIKRGKLEIELHKIREKDGFAAAIDEARKQLTKEPIGH
jgi:hypothetical protein